MQLRSPDVSARRAAALLLGGAFAWFARASSRHPLSAERAPNEEGQYSTVRCP